MEVCCPTCGAGLTVPEYRASNPDAALRCRGCNGAFTLSQAQGRAGSPPPLPVRAAQPGPPVSAPRAARPASGARPAVAPALAVPVQPPDYLHCTNHPEAPSVSVCGNCVKGFCVACAVEIRGALVCPLCDTLATPAEKYRHERQVEVGQARPMWDDLGTIFAYPFRDKLAYVLLALFTWFFGALGRLAAFGGGVGVLFSQGVLYWYCFAALSRVASGNLKDVMPEFRDISDLIQPLRLALATLLIASGPLLLLTLWFFPGLSLVGPSSEVRLGLPVAHAQAAEDAEAEPDVDAEETPEAGAAPADPVADEVEPEAGPGWGPRLALLLALFWQLVYTPVALTVAGLSRSMLSTLNPLLGIDTIGRMGSTYWQSAAIYTGLAVAQGSLGFGLAFVPFLGGLVAAFVDAYVFLAVGCTLGLAVHKKARELGYD